MMSSYRSPITAAVLLIALAAPVEAQIPPDPGAAANIRESEQYTALLRQQRRLPSQTQADRMRSDHRPATARELHRLV